MNAITVRNLPAAVAKAVQEKAKKEGLSLNKTIVKLLEQALGLTRRGKTVAHHDLDHLAGSWSRAEYEAFMEAARDQRRIDPEMWQ